MTKFSVYVQLSRDEFIRATMIRSYKNFRGVLLCVVGVTSIVISILEITGWFHTKSSPLPSLFIGIYLLVAYPLMVAFAASRTYKASSFMNQGLTYAFSEEGLELLGNKDVEMKLEWAQFVKKQMSGNYLFLFTGKLNAFIIPKKDLTEEQLAFIGRKVPGGKI